MTKSTAAPGGQKAKAQPAGNGADTRGRLLLLEEQDRSRWDRAAIAEGTGLVTEALRCGRPGRFTLQAAIAAVHAEAPSYEETDWPQLLRLYGELLRAWPTPVVALNRVVPLAMTEGPQRALEEIEQIERDGRLAGYRYLPAAKADLLRRLGRRFLVDIEHDDPRALAGITQRDRASDAGACAGDDRDVGRKQRHGRGFLYHDF